MLICAHDCCNRSMHGRGLDGYITAFMLSLKCVLWLATESVGVVEGAMMRLNMTGMMMYQYC